MGGAGRVRSLSLGGAGRARSLCVAGIRVRRLGGLGTDSWPAEGSAADAVGSWTGAGSGADSVGSRTGAALERTL